MSRYIPKSHVIYTIIVIGFIYSLHVALPTYSNSSFLSLFASEQTVGYIYMAAAAVTILAFLIFPSFIRRLGNYRTAMLLIVLQMILFFELVFADSPILIATIFILQSACISIIGLNIDIFLESFTNEHRIGAVRGLFGAVINAGWLMAPLIGSMLINGNSNYRSTYFAGLLILLPLLYLVYKNFPKFKDPTYSHPSVWQLIKHISKDKNLVRIFSANIILQSFYAWMVVYSPIYLNKVIGFRWEEIGIILLIMLIPFPLVQYPLGKHSDGPAGEKKVMAIGFAIMGLSTIALSFFLVKSIIVWAILLFFTRVGAAAAEIMIETFFFKTVPAKDSPALGAFRVTRPLAYFVAPLITGIGLAFTIHQYLFIIVGAMCLLALWPVLRIKES